MSRRQSFSDRLYENGDPSGENVEILSAMSEKRSSEEIDLSHEEEASRPILNGSSSGHHPIAVAITPPTRKPISPVIIIPVWIGLSGCVILFNKYIFSTLDFPYPVTLTAYHMLVATVGTRLLRFLPGNGRLKPAKVDIPWNVYYKTIVPLALLFSASLILSNIAYVYLSVSFVQMLKAFIPILTLIIQLVAGLQEYNHLLLGIILLTSLGCSIAANGELRFSLFGFICQVSAVVVESARLVLIQILLKDFRMDPLASIAMYAPLCVGMIGFCIPFMEGTAPFHNLYKVGLPTLLFNGAIAFSLNVAGVFLIDSAGSLVLTLSGVFKDILLITFSVLLLGSTVTGTQMGGYLIALSAIMLFKLTGGSPNSPIARKVLNAIQPVTDVFQNNKSRRNASAYRVGIIIAASTVVLLSLGGSGSSWLRSSSSPAQYTSQVSYPINSPVTRQQENKFSLFTQHGPGLDIIPPFDDTIDVSRLPRLAWVIVATPNAIVEHGEMLNQISCYCAKKNIPFFLEHKIQVSDRHFFTARHRSVAKYLRYYQWVFVTDADLFIGDSTRDLREFLDDSVDVIFNDRRTTEVCACAFYIKNSPGGWSFLRRWFAWADTRDNINYDNGDLVELVAAGLVTGAPNNADYTGRITREQEKGVKTHTEDPTTACVNGAGWGWWEYKGIFMPCFDNLVRPWRYADDTVPYWEVELWNFTKTLPSVKFRSYKVLAGFNRWGQNPAQPSVGWDSVGLPGDFLVSAKGMSDFLSVDAVLCTGQDWLQEPRWSLEEAREHIGKEGSITWWPGCFEADGRYACGKEE